MKTVTITLFYFFYLLICGYSGILSQTNLSSPVDSVERSTDTQNNFIRPYIKDWFTDLIFRDIVFTIPLEKCIKDLLKLHHISDTLEYDRTPTSFLPDELISPSLELIKKETGDPEFKLTIPNYVKNTGSKPNYSIKIANYSYYHLYPFIVDGKIIYQPKSIADEHEYLGETNSIPIGLYDKSRGAISVDLNKDGLIDHTELNKQNLSIGNHMKFVWKGFRNTLNTGYGYVEYADVSKFLFDFRIGYIFGYYLNFNKTVTSNFQNDTETIPLESNISVDQSSTIPNTNHTFIQPIRFQKYLFCSYYEDLDERKFLDNNKGNENLLIGYYLGLINGEKDGLKYSEKIEELNMIAEELKSVKKVDSTLYLSKSQKFIDATQSLLFTLLDFPIYKVSFKNKNNGQTVSLNRLIQKTNIFDKKYEETDRKDLEKKILRQPYEESVPFFKDLGNDLKSSDWYICYPGIVTGNVLAYMMSNLSIADTSVRNKLKTTGSTSDVIEPIRKDIYSKMQSYKLEDLKNELDNPLAISNYQFREGFRNSTKYLDNAYFLVGVQQGREEATKEILEHLKLKFPAFNPSPDVDTPDEAKVYIASFIGNLYDIIHELESTIVQLKQRIVEFEQVINELQKTLQATQSTLKSLEEAAKSGGNILKKIDNVGNVFYVGFSFSLSSPIANSLGKQLGKIGNGVGGWIDKW